MITVQGMVPFPPNADGRPIAALAASLQQFSSGLQQTSGQLTGAASVARSSWTGVAAEAFGRHEDERARTVSSVAQSVGQAVPVLQTFAAAIDASATAYSIAATNEHIARAGLPWTSAALAAAIAAEWGALGALQAAGAACASGLAVIEAEILAAQFFGVDRQSFESIKGAVMGVWESVSDVVEAGGQDVEDDARSAAATLDTSMWDSALSRLGTGVAHEYQTEAGDPWLGEGAEMPAWLLNGDQTPQGWLQFNPGNLDIHGDVIVIDGVGRGVDVQAEYGGATASYVNRQFAGFAGHTHDSLQVGPEGIFGTSNTVGLVGSAEQQELSVALGERLSGSGNVTSVTGVSGHADGAFALSSDGASGHLRGDALLGVQRTADMNVQVGEHVSLTGTGSMTGGAYAAIDTELAVDANGASYSGKAEALAGVKGDASSTMDVGGIGSVGVEADGRAGAWADAEAEAFIRRQEGGGYSFGANAEASAAALAAEGDVGGTVDVGDGLFGGHVEASGSVGGVAKAGGGFQVDVGWDRLGVAVSGDIAAGVGAGVDAGVYFSPTGIADAATDGYEYAAEAVSSGVESLTDWANETADSFNEAMPWSWGDDE